MGQRKKYNKIAQEEIQALFFNAEGPVGQISVPKHKHVTEKDILIIYKKKNVHQYKIAQYETLINLTGMKLFRNDAPVDTVYTSDAVSGCFLGESNWALPHQSYILIHYVCNAHFHWLWRRKFAALKS